MYKFEYKPSLYVTLEARVHGDKFDYLENGPNKGLFDGDIATFSVYDVRIQPEVIIGSFNFSTLTGCCGVVVSSATYLDKRFRWPHSHSLHFRNLKTVLAKHMGYGVMIATTQMASIPSVKNMIRSDYKMPFTFTNPRTKHLLGFGYKVL